MGILIESKNKICDACITDEELNNAAKELMRPFMERYIQDIIDAHYFNDIHGECPICETPWTKIDIRSDYVTYNNGIHADPEVHGESIRLEIKPFCTKCDIKDIVAPRIEVETTKEMDKKVIEDFMAF